MVDHGDAVLNRHRTSSVDMPCLLLSLSDQHSISARQNRSSTRGDAGQILGNAPLVNPQKGVSVKQSKAKHAFQHAKSVPRFREKLEPIYFEYLEKLDELSGKGVGNSLLPIGKNISTLR
jgi:hypothetical protein